MVSSTGEARPSGCRGCRSPGTRPTNRSFHSTACLGSCSTPPIGNPHPDQRSGRLRQSESLQEMLLATMAWSAVCPTHRSSMVSGIVVGPPFAPGRVSSSTGKLPSIHLSCNNAWMNSRNTLFLGNLSRNPSSDHSLQKALWS